MEIEEDKQIIQDHTARKWRSHENTACALGLVYTPIWQESGILIRNLYKLRHKLGYKTGRWMDWDWIKEGPMCQDKKLALYLKVAIEGF